MPTPAFKRLAVCIAAVSVVVAVGLAAVAGAGRADEEQQELTVLTNAISMFGLTEESLKSKNTIASWYRHYHELWEKKFPNLKINEIQTTGDDENITKTLLAVNAGNPADLLALHGQLPVLVARGAVENLDKYYAAAGLTPKDFLKPIADAARFNSHWYGMPGATNPASGNLLYIPKLVKAAGINKVPITWSGLYQASQKVVRFDDKGNLTRIGFPVDTGNTFIDLWCGRQTTYNSATNSFNPTAPCVKSYYAYNLKLLKLYGGNKKYTKFITGDQYVWSCSPKAYLPAGKILFMADAYWSGGQMDTCYNLTWKLGPVPTHTGSLKEWAGVQAPAWVLLIPKGAKNPQLAFDFVNFTIFQHGDRLGPTTNGYVRPGQATAWANGLSKYTGSVRKKNHYPGNPMVEALKWVKLGATLGRWTFPRTPATPYYQQQMSLAWQSVAYGRSSIDDALQKVKTLVDRQVKLYPPVIG